MQEVEGIILVLTCKKYINIRLSKFKLKHSSYKNWKVIYVIGNMNIEKDFFITGDFMYIKCEDTYLHLLKKLSLSLKYLYQTYEIKQGVLRCGDDLVFNEEHLCTFLEMKNKPDFYGKAYNGKDYYNEDITVLKNVKQDLWMYGYYIKHQEDMKDVDMKNITINDLLKKYNVRSVLDGPAGVIYYLSNKVCNLLVDHMENIHFNILHLDSYTNSYPYTIEDVGVTYIMYYNRIKFTNNSDFFDSDNSIVKHTNYGNQFQKQKKKTIFS